MLSSSRQPTPTLQLAENYGTLSEIAFALQMGKPVVGIRTWDVKGVVSAEDAEDAVNKIYKYLSAA
jgi:hypothetical protein